MSMKSLLDYIKGLEYSPYKFLILTDLPNQKGIPCII